MGITQHRQSIVVSEEDLKYAPNTTQYASCSNFNEVRQFAPFFVSNPDPDNNRNTGRIVVNLDALK